MSNLEKSLNEAFGLPNGMWVSPEGEIYPLRDTHAVDGYHIVKKLWPDVTMVDPPDSIEILIDQKWTRVTGPRIPVTHEVSMETKNLENWKVIQKIVTSISQPKIILNNVTYNSSDILSAKSFADIANRLEGPL